MAAPLRASIDAIRLAWAFCGPPLRRCPPCLFPALPLTHHTLHTTTHRVQLKGVTTNLEFLRVIAASPAYAAGDTTTKFVEGIDYSPHAGEGWCVCVCVCVCE